MQRRLAYDVETNGLLQPFRRDGKPCSVATKVHCICAVDIDTGEEFAFVPPHYKASGVDGTLEEGLVFLSSASKLYAHNGQGYDERVLKKLMGWEPSGDRLDTLIAAQVVWPDIKRDDFARKQRGIKIPGKLMGSHSLAAWGFRLGVLKGEFGEGRTDWEQFDQAMLDYCVQDCRVLASLARAIEAENPSPTMLKLEHEFAALMDVQMEGGITFDVAKAEALMAALLTEKGRLTAELSSLFPPRVLKYRTEKKKLEREKVIPFNPGSRDQIAWHLREKYGWESPKLTPTGKPKIDEKTLKTCPHPEAKKLLQLLLVAKRTGMLGEGPNALLKTVRPTGRIHHRVLTNGTVTGRPAFSGHNIGQIPAVYSPYGKEFRELFRARHSWKMVGGDASGIQLRLLAHFMAPFDGGEYVKVVTEGDPHAINQAAAGLPTRDLAKTFIYGFLFGAGAAKLGTIVGGGPREGKRLLAKFLKALPALAKLREKVGKAVEKGFLWGLDRRKYPIRSAHVGLNVVLMGAEAIIMKWACVEAYRRLASAGFTMGVDYQPLAYVYDEIQMETRPPVAQFAGECIRESIIRAGEIFNIRCPLDAEFKIGETWADTH